MISNNPNSEIYRFAAVRAISMHSSDALTKRFILLKNDSDLAKMQAKYPNSLFFKLTDLNEYSALRLKVLVDKERQSSKLLLKPEELDKVFPIDTQTFYSWVN